MYNSPSATGPQPSAESDVSSYLDSISQYTLLKPDETRTLLYNLDEVRKALTTEAIRIPTIRSEVLDVFQRIKGSGTETRHYLEFGQHELPQIQKKLNLHLPLLRALDDKISTTEDLRQKTRIEEKMGILVQELRLKDPKLRELCAHYLENNSSQALDRALTQSLEIRNSIMEANLRLVVSMAKRYAHRGPLVDLIQAGNIGLMRAIDRFKPSLGLQFSTYATPWIRQGIELELKRNGKVIREPNHMHDLKLQVQEAQAALYADNLPSNEPLYIRNWLKENVSNKARIPSLSSIEAALSPRRPVSLTAISEPLDTSREASENLTALVFDEVQTLIKALPEQQRVVIEGRFGLNNNPPKTLQDMANLMKISRERVRQIEVVALEALTKYLAV